MAVALNYEISSLELLNIAREMKTITAHIGNMPLLTRCVDENRSDTWHYFIIINRGGKIF
jgi:hypothetical protein